MSSNPEITSHILALYFLLWATLLLMGKYFSGIIAITSIMSHNKRKTIFCFSITGFPILQVL